MENKRIRTEASRKADKKYNEKRINFGLGYTTANINDGLRLKAYLADTGQSANEYLRALVKNDLDSKCIPYPSENND